MTNIWNVFSNIYYEPWRQLLTDSVLTPWITYIWHTTWSVKPILESEAKFDIYIRDKTVAWKEKTKRPIDANWNYINSGNLVWDDRATYTYA